MCVKGEAGQEIGVSQHRSLWAAGCAAGVHKRRLRAGAKDDLRTHTLRMHSRLHFEIGGPSPQEEGREWVDGVGRTTSLWVRPNPGKT